MDIKGLSIKNIIEMDYSDIRSLTRQELAEVTSRLVSVTNKRLRIIEKSTLGESPAYKNFISRTGDTRLSVKGKSQGQLQHVFTEAKHFLTLKTSTVRGYRRIIKNAQKTIADKVGFTPSIGTMNTVFSALHKLQQSGIVDGRGTVGSKEARNFMFELMSNNPNMSEDDLYNVMADSEAREEYERQMEESINEDEYEYEIDDDFSDY